MTSSTLWYVPENSLRSVRWYCTIDRYAPMQLSAITLYVQDLLQMHLVCTETYCEDRGECDITRDIAMLHVCTEYVPVHTAFMPVCTWHVCEYTYSEPCFTGFRGELRDANLLVPGVQQPPANSHMDRGDVLSTYTLIFL